MKGKAKEPRTENKKETNKEESNKCKYCGAETAEEFCSAKCEVAYWRAKAEEKEEIIQNLGRKKAPPQCLFQILLKTSIREYYTRKSLGAKRRACELRKLGFECDVYGAGVIYADDGKETKIAVAVIKRIDGKEYPAPVMAADAPVVAVE